MTNGENNNRLNDLINGLSGLKHSDWCRVKEVVDRVYKSQAAKLELNDIESLQKLIRKEFTL